MTECAIRNARDLNRVERKLEAFVSEYIRGKEVGVSLTHYMYYSGIYSLIQIDEHFQVEN